MNEFNSKGVLMMLAKNKSGAPFDVLANHSPKLSGQCINYESASDKDSQNECILLSYFVSVLFENSGGCDE